MSFAPSVPLLNFRVADEDEERELKLELYMCCFAVLLRRALSLRYTFRYLCASNPTHFSRFLFLVVRYGRGSNAVSVLDIITVLWRAVRLEPLSVSAAGEQLSSSFLYLAM